MAVLLKTLRRVCFFFLAISGVIIACMAVYTVYCVIMRYVFGSPISGMAEWSQIMLIVSMAGMGFAIADGRATRVNVLVDRFPKKVNIVFEIVMGAIGFVFFLLVGWRLISQVESSMRFGEAYFYIGFPRWPCYLALGVSFLSAAVGTVIFVINSIINFKAPRERGVLDDNPDIAILAIMEEEERKDMKKTGGPENPTTEGVDE